MKPSIAVFIALALPACALGQSQVTASLEVASQKPQQYDPICFLLRIGNPTNDAVTVFYTPATIEIEQLDAQTLTWNKVDHYTELRGSLMDEERIVASSEVHPYEFVLADSLVPYTPGTFRAVARVTVKPPAPASEFVVATSPVSLTVSAHAGNHAALGADLPWYDLIMNYGFTMGATTARSIDSSRVSQLIADPQISPAMRDYLNTVIAEHYFATGAYQDSFDAANAAVTSLITSDAGALRGKTAYLKARAQWHLALEQQDLSGFDAATKQYSQLPQAHPLIFKAHDYQDYSSMRACIPQ